MSYAYAEKITVTGEAIHFEDTSIKEGCEIAKKDALSKAKEKVLGLKIYSEESEMCSEIDGETNCIRNQLFLSDTLGHITNYKIIDKNKSTRKIENSDEDAYVCSITLEANVEERLETLDSSYDFGIQINNLKFQENDSLTIDITLTKPIFLNIFQWLPYEKEKTQVYKIFPNDKEPNNFIEKTNFKYPTGLVKSQGKLRVEFPKNIKNKDSVDEYLFFIFSKNNINFLPKYTTREDLIGKYMSEKNVKFIYKGYTIIK